LKASLDEVKERNSDLEGEKESILEKFRILNAENRNLAEVLHKFKTFVTA